MHRIDLKILSFFFMFCAGIFLLSCASSGKKFDESLIPKIEKGVTTKKDIVSMFGEPVSKQYFSGGEVWSYQYSSGHVTGAGMAKTVLTLGVLSPDTAVNVKNLEINFNNDLVQDYSFTTLNQ